MRIHTLDRSLVLPQPVETVFAFFADARNLEAITPPWLRFRVLDPAPIRMETGARIHYRLRVHGLPLRWESEITVWEPPLRFVDVQRRGPYRLWEHEHRFEACAEGTRVLDHVEYAVPGGALVHRLLVARDVNAIFDYRGRVLAQRFAAGG